MIDEKRVRDNFQWIFDANNTTRTTVYLKLHNKLTHLAFAKVRDWECAKDIASECLINYWQCTVADMASVSASYLSNELNRLCCLYFEARRRLLLFEEAYYSNWSSPASVWEKFRIGDRMEVSRLFSLLEEGENTVVHLMIFEEMDLLQIAEKIRKPLATVKVLRDRAIYQLKKRLNPKALPINQLSAFISLFSGIAVAT